MCIALVVGGVYFDLSGRKASAPASAKGDGKGKAQGGGAGTYGGDNYSAAGAAGARATEAAKSEFYYGGEQAGGSATTANAVYAGPDEGMYEDTYEAMGGERPPSLAGDDGYQVPRTPSDAGPQADSYLIIPSGR